MYNINIETLDHTFYVGQFMVYDSFFKTLQQKFPHIIIPTSVPLPHPWEPTWPSEFPLRDRAPWDTRCVTLQILKKSGACLCTMSTSKVFSQSRSDQSEGKPVNRRRKDVDHTGVKGLLSPEQGSGGTPEEPAKKDWPRDRCGKSRGWTPVAS